MNSMKQQTRSHLDGLAARHPQLGPCLGDIEKAYDALLTCHAKGGRILACGNGGSAADAEHIVGELMNKYLLKRPMPRADADRVVKAAGALADEITGKLQRGIPAFSLVSQSALTSAISNDIGPDLVFAQQVYACGRAGDVLLALSTSGNSTNVIMALVTARAFGVTTIGLTGAGGGSMEQWCDVLIRVPATVSYLVQELHEPVYHVLCAMLESELFGE